MGKTVLITELINNIAKFTWYSVFAGVGERSRRKHLIVRWPNRAFWTKLPGLWPNE